MTIRAPRSKFRAALLGATAALVIGGASVQTFAPPAPAVAQALAQAQAPFSFADTVERVRGAVVSVKVRINDSGPAASSDDDGPGAQPGDPLERFFRRFGENGIPGLPGMGGQRPRRFAQSQGSGFIISADGYVVTNNHVVENARDVTLTLDGGKTVEATVIGTDKRTDLALLKIKASGTYPFVSFAGKAPRVGDWVVAIGNPFGLGGTVTAGIVSARGRDIGSGPYDDFLQIDAPVNRGNSGGPTFNFQGEVVGVNTAIYSPSGGSVGIGFAIPSDTVKTVIAALKDNGSVARGYIGVQIQPVTDEIADSLGLKAKKGALIAEASSNAPAAAAGLRSGDVITAVNGETVEAPRDLSRKIAAYGPGKTVDVTYVRDGAEKTASVRLAALPDETARADRPSRGGETERGALTGFGMSLAPSPNGRDGVVIAEVDPSGAAAEKGLRRGDVIMDVNGKAVSRPADVRSAVEAARKDGRRTVLLRVRSSEGVRFVALAVRPTAG